jgi:hypothetical protein
LGVNDQQLAQTNRLMWLSLTAQRKEMRYFTKPKNGYSIRVIFDQHTGGWQTKKFKGRKLIRSAFGSTFEQAMIHTTMDGRESDER